MVQYWIVQNYFYFESLYIYHLFLSRVQLVNYKLEQIFGGIYYFVAFNCSALFMLWVPATFVAVFVKFLTVLFPLLYLAVLLPQMRDDFI